jgi:endoglucanase
MRVWTRNHICTLRLKHPVTSFFVFLLFCIALDAPALSKGNVLSLGTDTTIVQRYGSLRTVGNRVVDKNGNPAVLRGMSLFWSQWMGQFYNRDCVQWLRDDWKCSVVRAAMAVDQGGYLTNGLAEKVKILSVIDACIDLGIYVIVDWHEEHAQWHRPQAIAFFEDIAKRYHDKPNIIYEIFNEPLQVSWADSIKPYADSVVRHIRAIDPNNLIVVGNPTWSQDVDVAAANPLDSSYHNIAYTLHFYAATHKQSLRNKATVAMARGAALFVTEFGTTTSSGGGTIDSAETVTWMQFMSDNGISWCNWSVADKDETSAALKPGANATGGWPLSSISISGQWIRNKIRTGNAALVTGVLGLSETPLQFQLHQNYPNPFNPSTTIRYEVPVPGGVTITIYDVLGRQIRILMNEEKQRGAYSIQWDASEVSNGVYFYQMKAGTFTDVKRLVVVK